MYSVEEDPCAGVSGSHNVYLLTNSSLLICGLGPGDVGSYHCEVNTSLGEVVRSQPSSVYLTAPFPWWVVIIAISVLIFILLLCLICYCKRRRTGKGYYGMQRQHGHLTVEEMILRALVKAQLLDKGSYATPQRAGFQRTARTDKGVSAARQVSSGNGSQRTRRGSGPLGPLLSQPPHAVPDPVSVLAQPSALSTAFASRSFRSRWSWTSPRQRRWQPSTTLYRRTFAPLRFCA